jgi:hypothetical protein
MRPPMPGTEPQAEPKAGRRRVHERRAAGGEAEGGARVICAFRGLFVVEAVVTQFEQNNRE